jgi:hypothetical protein
MSKQAIIKLGHTLVIRFQHYVAFWRRCEKEGFYRNNVTNLIHFSCYNHFIVSSTCFEHQASIFRRHYTSSFWCDVRWRVGGWGVRVDATHTQKR